MPLIYIKLPVKLIFQAGAVRVIDQHRYLLFDRTDTEVNRGVAEELVAVLNAQEIQ